MNTVVGNRSSTKKLVLCSILTALVIVLQCMGSFIKFGPFSISLVLLPIVIGAALCGSTIGAWLGLVFGVVVLMTDAGAFLAISIPGTVITVLTKGVLCGLGAALAYRYIKPYRPTVAVATAALVCPIINTGIFLLGCLTFFMDTIGQWAAQFGFGENVAAYMIFVLVGGNFLFELATNFVLSPIILRLLQYRRQA
ncbi:MAG: ECF transporter S component [Ruminococcaceae bacterium]|nr:ECF transporter S component [Oscillospiraceae bacterium]